MDYFYFTKEYSKLLKNDKDRKKNMLIKNTQCVFKKRILGVETYIFQTAILSNNG
jgi:hypothetical protein